MADVEEYVLLTGEIYTKLTGSELTAAENTVIELKILKLISMLRDDIDDAIVDGYKELICYTAALMTAFDISEKEKALYHRPVKIGDITMKSPMSSEGLKALINENLRELSCILTDKNFIFKVMEAEE